MAYKNCNIEINGIGRIYNKRKPKNKNIVSVINYYFYCNTIITPLHAEGAHTEWPRNPQVRHILDI